MIERGFACGLSSATGEFIVVSQISAEEWKS